LRPRRAKDTPSLEHCVPGCGNIARTEQHAAQLRERARILENQAVRVPQPVGDRLRASAARLVRRGAGPIPAAASTRRIVPSLTRYPRPIQGVLDL
jgi:hypothetical protein